MRNNTNVRAESDIDVAIVCHESIYYKLPDGTDAATFGITTPAAYSFAQFRNDLEAALRAKFGSAVKPTDKTFDVPENTYRMEADVTPFFEYRRYSGSGRADLQWAYEEGVMSVSKSGLSFTNWHADHYREGVGRNDTTRKRFKRVVRILKTKIACWSAAPTLQGRARRRSRRSSSSAWFSTLRTPASTNRRTGTSTTCAPPSRTCGARPRRRGPGETCSRSPAQASVSRR